MKFVNLTPHSITLLRDNGTPIILPPDGRVARVSVSSSVNGYINSVPVYEASYGDVVGLPEAEADIVYIVSAMVASRIHDRSDVCALAEFVRDGDENIIGAKGLQRI